jgi:hypothetical protein
MDIFHNIVLCLGLGTGGLYTNDCPLRVSQGQLWYAKSAKWIFDFDDIYKVAEAK